MAQADALCRLRRDAVDGSTSWAWRKERTPPSDATIAAAGFRGAVWADGLPRDAPNLLLLLHGLGDVPAPFARFASQLRLPQTSALSLPATLPLPHGIPGRMWHESFEADGSLIADGIINSSGRSGEHRQLTSLERSTRPRLRRLLRLLVLGCGWRLERIFIFGFAQGGTAALDLLSHIRTIDGSSEGELVGVERPVAGRSGIDEGEVGVTGACARLGGVVSWCGLPLSQSAMARSSSLTTDGTTDGTGSGVLGSRSPLLVVSGEQDTSTPPASAQAAFDALCAGWRLATDGQASLHPAPEQAMHVLPGRRQEMVQGPQEAKLLMEFFARHLSLSSALEDDPNVRRVS